MPANVFLVVMVLGTPAMVWKAPDGANIVDCEERRQRIEPIPELNLQTVCIETEPDVDLVPDELTPEQKQKINEYLVKRKEYTKV